MKYTLQLSIANLFYKFAYVLLIFSSSLGNVLKEICEPAGAVIYSDRFVLGDPTLSLMELWGAEYQESNAILINNNHRGLVQSIADRERCPVAFVGEITGDGKVSVMKIWFPIVII